MDNIMLISTAYGPHHDRSAYVIDINMMLHTVFKMFVDYMETTLGRRIPEYRIDLALT